MSFAPAPRTSVSDTVFGRVVDEILSGRLPAGDPLPSERDLAVEFQVNRHAVREALKRIQQAGLVQISHGGKTRVLDWRDHAGLDVLSALTAAGVIPPRQVMHDVAVMRRSIAADAARLCATEASDEQLARIHAAAQAYPGPGDDDNGADLAFWTAVIDGSGNLAYRLALNTLVASFRDIGSDIVGDAGAAEFTDREGHIELAVLIGARDAAGAHRKAEKLLTLFVTAFVPATSWE